MLYHELPVSCIPRVMPLCMLLESNLRSTAVEKDAERRGPMRHLKVRMPLQCVTLNPLSQLCQARRAGTICTNLLYCTNFIAFAFLPKAWKP